jgi:hypothetical protein
MGVLIKDLRAAHPKLLELEDTIIVYHDYWNDVEVYEKINVEQVILRVVIEREEIPQVMAFLQEHTP